MSAPTDDISDVLAHVFLWIESATIRMSAMESIIKSRLSLTEQEFAEALAKASAEFPPAPVPKLEGAAAMIDFLLRATPARES